MTSSLLYPLYRYHSHHPLGRLRGVQRERHSPPRRASWMRGLALQLLCVAACFGSVRRANGQPSLNGVQTLAINEQGNGWFRSVSSKRQDANSSAFPMKLAFTAMESGMMSYSETRSGLVLTFEMDGWDPSTHDAFLTLDWAAQASPATGTAVLRVDQTSCGAQRSDVRLFHSDCVALNTGGCDSDCYCSVVPCVLEDSLAGNQTWYLGSDLTSGNNPDTTPLKLVPNPGSEEGILQVQVFRLTPLTTFTYTSGMTYTQTITINDASVELRYQRTLTIATILLCFTR